MAKQLKLGVMLGYWGAQPPSNLVELAQEAEKLGCDSIWSAEAWGSDAFTPLAWIGAHTSRIKLGTSIAQIAARTPTSTAMHALTLDHLSGGRMILGLGVSGPQVVEGWYGQPFGKPLARTREYVDIIRQVLRREAPVANDGEHYPLPYTGKGAWGLGKSLRPITHPLRADLPIYLGAEGPKNVALAAEIADGWLPLYYSPFRQEVYAASLGDLRPDFEIAQMVIANVTDDVEAGLMPVKSMLGFYIGGMGAKKRNFHKELMGQDPGPVPRGKARRGDPQRPHGVRRRDLPGRPEGARPGAAGGVEGDAGDDAAGAYGRPGHAAHDGRARSVAQWSPPGRSPGDPSFVRLRLTARSLALPCLVVPARAEPGFRVTHHRGAGGSDRARPPSCTSPG
jgi:F420-dependent oxidoreductase-like protein